MGRRYVVAALMSTSCSYAYLQGTLMPSLVRASAILARKCNYFPSCSRWLLHIGKWCPDEASGDGPAVILTLDGKSLAALIEPEDFVGKVEESDVQVNTVSMGHAIAHLCVYLGMGIEVIVSVGTLNPAGCAICEIVEGDVCIVMRQSHARGDGPFVVRGVEIPVVGSLS